MVDDQPLKLIYVQLSESLVWIERYEGFNLLTLTDKV